MALTRELKTVGSPINQYFGDYFSKTEEIAKYLSNSASNLTTLLPSDQKNYPWSDIGHMAEYLLDLRLGLDYQDLYPMQILQRYKPEIHNFITSNFTSLSLSTRSQFEQACFLLYKLSIVEGWARRGSFGDWSIFHNALVTQVMIDDLWNIYHESIVVNETINKDVGAYYNPNFVLSGLVGGADADLIMKDDNGGLLIDLKTTKNPLITTEMLFQLVSYTFLDETDDYNIKEVGIYLTRQNKVVTISVDEIVSHGSTFNSVEEAKSDFCKLVKHCYTDN